MFRLAHISDVHLRPLPKVSAIQLANKRITGYLNWQLNRKHAREDGYVVRLLTDLKTTSPDHTLVTGDLTNLSLPAEFENALTFLKSLGNPEDVTAQFGNHDAYVPGALRNAMVAWQDYAKSDKAPLNKVSDFPVLRTRGDVAIIACNSACATPPFFATGNFRADQAERLGKLLTETRGMCRIVAIHHPPFHGATRWHKRLIGIEKFQSTLREHGAELVLHGHTHLATTNRIDGPDHSIPVVCVPATGNGPGNSRPAGRYNLFSISKGKKGWKIHHEARACNPSGNGVDTVEELELSAG